MYGLFYLGPPIVPFSPLFWGAGFPTKIDYRKKGSLILTSLLEDLSQSLSVWTFHFLGRPLLVATKKPVVFPGQSTRSEVK